MTKEMKNENKFNLYNTRKNCKIELYSVGDNFAVEVIESKDEFIAWLHHPDSWFSLAIMSSRKKNYPGTKFAFEVNHDTFLEMVQRCLPNSIEIFKKKCPMVVF